jgi:hypothetical protein
MTVVMWDDGRHVSGPSVAFNPSGENFFGGKARRDTSERCALLGNGKASAQLHLA